MQGLRRSLAAYGSIRSVHRLDFALPAQTRSGNWIVWLFGHFPPMRTVMEAHANPEELRAVCRDTLAEARRLGVSVPRLAAAEPYFAAENHM
jgi:hypothetical protein